MSVEQHLGRSKYLSDRIRQRIDVQAQSLIRGYKASLDYTNLPALMISRNAWRYVERVGIAPKMVFAHPDLLIRHPETSVHYRGLV